MLGFRVGVRNSLQNTCNKLEAHIRTYVSPMTLDAAFTVSCLQLAFGLPALSKKPWTRRIFAMASNARCICMSVILECSMQALSHKNVVCCLIASQ